eukprot:6194772-Pleurochrysis_carterae.AAC.2
MSSRKRRTDGCPQGTSVQVMSSAAVSVWNVFQYAREMASGMGFAAPRLRGAVSALYSAVASRRSCNDAMVSLSRARHEDHLRGERVRLQDDSGCRSQDEAEDDHIDARGDAPPQAVKPACHGGVPCALQRRVAAHHPHERRLRPGHLTERCVRGRARGVEQDVQPALEPVAHRAVTHDGRVGTAAELLVRLQGAPQPAHAVSAAPTIKSRLCKKATILRYSATATRPCSISWTFRIARSALSGGGRRRPQSAGGRARPPRARRRRAATWMPWPASS